MESGIVCSHCSKALTPDASGRFPPWCRHCGADLKASAPAPPSSPPPHQVVTERPAVAVVEAPPLQTVARPALRYFHAASGALGGDEIYRIYVTDVDLLIFQLGPGRISQGQFTPKTKQRFVVGGGIIVALAQWRETQRLQRAARVRDMLETADEETLREYAAARDAGYIVRPDDVQDMSIDPPAFWIRLFGADCEGVLKFRHRSVGKKSLALMSAKDVRDAAEAVTRLFGETVRINLPWALVRS